MSYTEYMEATKQRDSLIDSVLDLARGEIGVTEDAGEDEDKAGHIAMYRSVVTDLDVDPDRGPEAWCACFVSWLFHSINMALGVDGRGFRSCARMKKWFEFRGMYRAAFLADPQPADIVFIDGNKNGTPDHCGIVERVEGEQSIIHTIEGNYSDRCCRVQRRDQSLIMGYGIVIE